MTEPSPSIEDIRLLGVECEECSIVLFGRRGSCENCGSTAVSGVTFSDTGQLYSFTVQRHPPSPPYKLGSTEQEDWEPRPVGYVDLPEGARILSIIDAPIDALEIGQQVSLMIERGWTDDEGEDVLIYKFAPEASA